MRERISSDHAFAEEIEEKIRQKLSRGAQTSFDDGGGFDEIPEE